MLSGPPSQSRRELMSFDTLDPTVHLLVHADTEPVAKLRLLLPNPEVAARVGGTVGIDMEQRVDLSGVIRWRT
ncbi:hypothetical protein [Corallococcus sp. 4LFB]|uniref:hypothetical protein n=1 Tax=Corallococcus sp. 4LFB TaxID=3383249 RepID=UPI003975A8DA